MISLERHLIPTVPFIRKAISTIAVFLMMNLIIGTALFGAVSAAHAGVLKKITGLDKETYSSIVFQFGSNIRFEKPVIDGKEAFIRFNDTTTKLDSLHEFNNFDSWVKLKKEGNDLEVRIGLPANFQEFRYFPEKYPNKLAIRFYKSGTRLSSLEGYSAIIGADSRTSLDTDNDKPEQVLAVTDGKKKNVIHQSISTESLVKKKKSSDPLHDKGLLSLNFNQSDIRDILLAVAMNHDVNIVMTPDVTGKASVHLYRLPLEEALGSIAIAGGFTYIKRGNVYNFYKPKEVRDPQSERLEMRIFQLKFAAIDKVQDVLSAIPGVRTVKIHESSKTIVVEDTPENIRKIEAVINQWDTLPRQVLIEAKILQITLNDDMAMGVDWNKLIGDATIGTTGLIVPKAGSFIKIVTGAGTTTQFTAALNFLRGITNVNFLSTPKILAIHGKAARVQVGGKQGYKVTTSNMGVTSETIQFIDTGTILDITPYIDGEGNVLLTVQPSINTADVTSGIPVVKSTTVSTSCMAKDGETVFIGGLIEESKTITRDLVPWFGEIPILGSLFGQKKRSIGKSEFVVLITPHILETNLKRQAAKGLEKTRQTAETLNKEPLSTYKQLLEPVTEK